MDSIEYDTIYSAALTSAAPIAVTTCPSGVRRHIVACGTRPATTTFTMLYGIRRGPTDYYTHSPVALSNSYCPQWYPIALEPGDSLLLMTSTAGGPFAAYIGFGYIDEPLTQARPKRVRMG